MTLLSFFVCSPGSYSPKIFIKAVSFFSNLCLVYAKSSILYALLVYNLSPKNLLAVWGRDTPFYVTKVRPSLVVCCSEGDVPLFMSKFSVCIMEERKASDDFYCFLGLGLRGRERLNYWYRNSLDFYGWITWERI